MSEGDSVMLYLKAVRFYCSECGSNVFTEREPEDGRKLYSCNGCGARYVGWEITDGD